VIGASWEYFGGTVACLVRFLLSLINNLVEVAWKALVPWVSDFIAWMRLDSWWGCKLTPHRLEVLGSGNLHVVLPTHVLLHVLKPFAAAPLPKHEKCSARKYLWGGCRSTSPLLCIHHLCCFYPPASFPAYAES